MRKIVGSMVVIMLLICSMESPGEAQASLDNNIWWDGVYHSQSGKFMSPLFPTSVQELTLFLRVNRNDINHARIRYWNGQEHYVDMIWDRADDRYDYWKGMIPASSTQVYYRFELIDGRDVDWYDAGGMSDEAKVEGDFTYFPVGGTPFYRTPDWVKQAVFYQIFPERFYNGDATNDPPGTEAWNSEPKTDNFMGGDLAGIIRQLDYLNDGDPDSSTDLGITAMYLNPIFESRTNHKYSTEDYERVDDNFGDNTVLATLISEAHQRGIRVVLDGVFNHTGVAHPFFDDVVEKGNASPYYNYYQIRTWPIRWYDDLNENGRKDEDEPYFDHWSDTTNDEYLRTNDYDAWWGFAHLPNLMTEHPAIRDYFIHDADAIAVRWLNMGIDGWRLDVANEIEDGFWRAFRERVKAVNPDAYIVGEYWGNAAKWLNGTMWDSTMNYRFRSAVQNFFAGKDDAGKPSQSTVEEFDKALYGIQSDYSAAAYSTALNLLDSHDTWRFMDRCGGDWEKFRMAVLFQMTYTGVPMIYYGDENGMSQWPNARKDPGNRSAMEWTTYTHPHQSQINEFYRTLIRIRLGHPALRSPHVRTMYRNNADRVYAYARRSETETLLILLNNSDSSQNAEFEIHGLFPDGTTLKDLLSGDQYTVSAGRVRIENLPKRSGLILSAGAPPNVPPTAAFRVTPASPKVSDTISFDGADSSDPDGVIVRYEWDWENDGAYDTDGSNVSRSFEEAGIHSVTLRVTDDAGETGITTQQISVRSDGETAEDVYGSTHAFAEENIYFVLTDRFVNGNSSNDVRDQGQQSGRPTWELRMDGPDGQYANIGYMGGDFEGLYQQAEYIKEMGSSAIWITPIVDNPDESFSGGQPCYFGAGIGSDQGKTGYHGYWGVNFYEVDEHLESPGFSFAEFTAKMKNDYDLKIILDIVCNHGSPSFSMTPQDQPKFGEIYDREGTKVADHENKPPNELDHANPLHQFYNKGGGLAQLSDLNEHHPPVLDYLTGAYLQWIEQGAAAFRIDTIAWMPHSFWKAFADRIRDVHPDFFMFGENFNYSAHAIAQHQKAENGGISVLDFPCKEAINSAFRPGGSYRSLEGCLHLTDGVYTNPYELVTFYDNHDMPRMGTDEQGFIDAHNWLFTARGIPCIYYGSENRFMAGKSEHQGNRNYYGTDRIQEARNSEIFKRLKKIATIRKSSVALQKGLQVNLFLSDNTAAFYRVFQYEGENQTALVLLNKGNSEIPFEITEYLSHGTWIDAETDDVYEVTSDSLTTSLPAHDVKVLLFNGPVNNAAFMTHLRAIMASQGEKVEIDPEPPVAGRPVTVSYRAIEGLTIECHWGKNNWNGSGTPQGDIAMSWNPERFRYECDIPVPEDAAQIDFVFHDLTNNRWDNNGGADWHVEVSR